MKETNKIRKTKRIKEVIIHFVLSGVFVVVFFFKFWENKIRTLDTTIDFGYYQLSVRVCACFHLE